MLLRDAPGNPEIVAGLRPRSGKLRAVLDQPSVDDKSRKLIGSCTDLGILNGWFRRAFKVDKASDLFEE